MTTHAVGIICVIKVFYVFYLGHVFSVFNAFFKFSPRFYVSNAFYFHLNVYSITSMVGVCHMQALQGVLT